VLQYTDFVCRGRPLTEHAHNLSECFHLALAHAADCPPYVAHSPEHGYCVACTANLVSRRRVAEPGYNIYSTGCHAAALTQERSAMLIAARKALENGHPVGEQNIRS
jgi:hypothetical protein